MDLRCVTELERELCHGVVMHMSCVSIIERVITNALVAPDDSSTCRCVCVCGGDGGDGMRVRIKAINRAMTPRFEMDSWYMTNLSATIRFHQP